MRSRRFSGFGLLLGAVLLSALGLLGFTAYQRLSSASDGEPNLLVHDVHVALTHLPTSGSVMHTIYLNREGATLFPGNDDSARNVSSIVQSTGKAVVHIPAFEGSAQTWSAFRACVRSKFLPFDISIVEERPVSGGYIMAVIGGTPEDLGAVHDEHGGAEHTHDVLGLAPFNGAAVPDAVVLIFAHRMNERSSSMCETAGMEIAHAYGLDHERNCRDLMTYMPPCGPRSFVNATARCGELADRNCEGGSETQNSFAKLLAAVGPASPGSVIAR